MHHKGIVIELRRLMLRTLERDDYHFNALAQLIAFDADLVLYFLRMANDRCAEKDRRPTSLFGIIATLGSDLIEQAIRESSLSNDEHGTQRRHMVSRYGQAHLSAMFAERAYPGMKDIARVYFLAGLLVDIIPFEYFVEVCHSELRDGLLTLAQGTLVLQRARALQKDFERGRKSEHQLYSGWDVITRRTHGILFPEGS